MKRLKKIIFLLVIILIGIKGIKAASLDTSISKSYIDNVWSFHYRNGRVFSYGQLKMNYANGKLAYCIQPETSINFDSLTLMIIGVFQVIQKMLNTRWNYIHIMDMVLKIIIVLNTIWLLKN